MTSKDLPHIQVSVRGFEHGKGPGVDGTEVPYYATIIMDGEEAFRFSAGDSKYTGQLHRFIKWLQANETPGDAPRPASRNAYTGWMLEKKKDAKWFDERIASHLREIEALKEAKAKR